MPTLHLPAVYADAVANAVIDMRLAVELDLAHLIVVHPEQHRDGLAWDAALHVCARKRAEQIRDRGAWGACPEWLSNPHVDADCRGPHWWLRAWGYPLPDRYSYGQAVNSVESLRLGPDDPVDVLAALLASPSHRAHILGTGNYSGSAIAVGLATDWNAVTQNFIWSILIV